MSIVKSIQAFEKANNRVIWEKLYNAITGRPHELLSFEAVKEALDLKIGVTKELQEIELSRIIGSVGRHQAFTRAFSPKHKWTRSRWQGIDQLFYKSGFEPIKVYQVGNVYFVEDGNHRISVSRAHGVKTIEAYVVEYQTDVPIYINDDLPSIVQRKNGAAGSQTQTKRRPAYNLLGDIWQWVKIQFQHGMG